MRLTIIAFGKLKTPGMRTCADHYLKGLHTWATVDEIELRPVPVPDKSVQSRSAVREKEADILLEHLAKRPRAQVILLDELGGALTSEKWGHLVRDAQAGSAGDLIFCIGGSLGFSDRVKQAAAQCISLGPQTLPHELARVVLLEQLFRALSIVNGHPYHNQG